MANSKHENFIPLECPESLFECLLCMEEFVSPRVLPCQHIFCKTCVLTLMKKSLKVNTPYRDSAFMCPVCRRECSYEVPRGKPIEEQISTFPESLLLKSFLEYRSNRAQVAYIDEKEVQSCGSSCAVAVQTTPATKDKRIQVSKKVVTIGIQIGPKMVNASVSTNNHSSTISTQTEYKGSFKFMSFVTIHRFGRVIKRKLLGFLAFLWQYICIPTAKTVAFVPSLLSILWKIAEYTIRAVIAIVLLVMLFAAIAFDFKNISQQQTDKEAGNVAHFVLILLVCILLHFFEPKRPIANQNITAQRDGLRLRGRRGDKHKIIWRPRLQSLQ